MAQRKCILYMTISLDGFIADENGNRNSLIEQSRKDINDFKEFLETVDVILMGRKTYDQIKNLPEWPYEGKKVYVITHYLKQNDEHVTFVHENIMGLVQNLKNEKGKNIWVMGGSEIANILIKEGLLDEYVLITIPTILGKGIRLFKDDNPTIYLNLKESKASGNCIISKYEKK